MSMSHRKVIETFAKPTPPGKERRMNRRRLKNELATAETTPKLSRKTERARMAAQAMAGYTEAERKRVAKEAYVSPTKGGTLAAAADAAGVSRSTVERWIIDDPAFREEMIEAHETVIDKLETLAFKRARGTRDQPGSDDLLKFLLRANRSKFAATAGVLPGTAAARAQDEEAKSAAQKQRFKIAGQEIEF